MIIIHLPTLQVSFLPAQGPYINNVRVLIYTGTLTWGLSLCDIG